LSFIQGCVNVPPPILLNSFDSVLGKEFSCEAINRPLSVKPAVKEAPTDTYVEKSAEPAVNLGNGLLPVSISLSYSQAKNAKERKHKPIYFIVFLFVFI